MFRLPIIFLTSEKHLTLQTNQITCTSLFPVADLCAFPSTSWPTSPCLNFNCLTGAWLFGWTLDPKPVVFYDICTLLAFVCLLGLICHWYWLWLTCLILVGCVVCKLHIYLSSQLLFSLPRPGSWLCIYKMFLAWEWQCISFISFILFYLFIFKLIN